jgi:beta-lactamase class D
MQIRLTTLALIATFLVACSDRMEAPAMSELPAGPGSMGPNLATGPDDEIVLSWMEPSGDGHLLRYSTFGAAGWSAPGTVAQGDNWFVNWADFPSVVPLSDRLWAAHWLVSQPEGGYAYDVNVSFSGDGGATWDEPFLPHFDGTPTEHGFVTLYPDSNGLGIVWLDGRKMINEYDENDVAASGMTLRAATFGTDQTPSRSGLVDDLTCDCCQTDVALTAGGPVVVYRDRTTEEVRDIYVSRREYGEWQPGVPVSTDDWEIPACPVNGPVILADGDLVAVAWFTAAGDRPMVKAAWSDDAGRTFSAPVVLESEVPLGHVGAAMLPTGELVVSYQKRVGNGGAELLLRRVSKSGGIGDAFSVPGSGEVFAFSVPQLALNGDQLVVAWTNAIDGEYSVQATLVSVDAVATPSSSQADKIADVFEEAGVTGAMVVETLSGTSVARYKPERLATRFSPASTFKIPNSLIALDLGVVDSAESTFTWDGSDKGREQWNQDQTLRSAYQVSCVWCYQEIARDVGAAAYHRALVRLDYGNREIGDAVDQFWLNGSLAISADEQIRFLRRLLNNEAGYSEQDLVVLRDIMRVEQAEDLQVYSKTGWTGPRLAVGWNVGYVTTDEGTFLFAMNMHMDQVSQAPLRASLTMDALRALGIL